MRNLTRVHNGELPTRVSWRDQHQETGGKKVFVDTNSNIRSHVYWIISKGKAIYNHDTMASKDKKLQEQAKLDEGLYVPTTMIYNR